MELLTNSRRTCFNRCRREHLYEYILRQRPLKKGDALAFGTLFHHGLEQWWLCFQPGKKMLFDNDGQRCAPGDIALDVALAAMRLAWEEASEEGDLNPFHLAKAEALMTGYHYRWRDAMAGLEVLAVEVQFEAPLRNPETGRSSRTFRLAGKLDVLVRVLDPELAELPHLVAGDIVFFEHKTTSSDISPEKDYWLRLRIDGQVSTYHAGAQALGYNASACVYDVVCKPGQHPRRATACEVDHRLEVCDKHFTKGKLCKACEGQGFTRGAFRGDDGELETREMPCQECADHPGWKEPRRFKANLILEDETPEEYRNRLIEIIADDPNRYLGRAQVIRLPDEQLEHETDAWLTAQAMRLSAGFNMHPRNPDACVRYGRFCSYFDVCTGAAAIDDPTRFRHSPVVHEELDHTDTEPEEEAHVG